MVFNPSRLKLARTRRQLTIKKLAELVGLTPRAVSEYEKERCTSVPKGQTIASISEALFYPPEFFFEEDDIDEVATDSVSFRSLKSMKASHQHAAISAGSLGVMVDTYLRDKFELPKVNLPDLKDSTPEEAATLIRSEWGLGNNSISDVISLLEKYGVRVYSLDEKTAAVDAFSFWRDGVPYVFLNTQKSGERSRFDACHELGHLVLHRESVPQGKDIEREADTFAAYFLMPTDTVKKLSGRFFSISDILKLKKSWKVSAMALIVHMRRLEVLSEWQYKSMIIEASKMGLRTKEIEGIPKEKSKLLNNILEKLKLKNIGVSDIAKDLKLPVEEVSNLLFRFNVIGGSNVKTNKPKPTLTVVK